jgi:hypothetical protein
MHLIMQGRIDVLVRPLPRDCSEIICLKKNPQKMKINLAAIEGSCCMPRLIAGTFSNTPVLQDPIDFKVVRARAFMREALLLLDQVGASLAGVQLQHAIDTLDLMPLVATQE